MLEVINKTLRKFFGNKSDRDMKELVPLAEKVKGEFPQLASLSNDEVRAKTDEFKQRIQDAIADNENELAEINQRVEENPDMEMAEKEQSYSRVDELKKERNTKIEEVKPIVVEVFLTSEVGIAIIVIVIFGLITL